MVLAAQSALAQGGDMALQLIGLGDFRVPGESLGSPGVPRVSQGSPGIPWIDKVKVRRAQAPLDTPGLPLYRRCIHSHRAIGQDPLSGRLVRLIPAGEISPGESPGGM